MCDGVAFDYQLLAALPTNAPAAPVSEEQDPASDDFEEPVNETKVSGCVGVSRRKVANERVVRGKT